MLRHADPASCFRPPGRSRRPAAPPLKSPVRLIYACRRDDVLMAPEIAKWCSAGVGRARLQRCVLAVSPPAEGQPEPPFTAAEAAAGGEGCGGGEGAAGARGGGGAGVGRPHRSRGGVHRRLWRGPLPLEGWLCLCRQPQHDRQQAQEPAGGGGVGSQARPTRVRHAVGGAAAPGPRDGATVGPLLLARVTRVSLVAALLVRAVPHSPRLQRAGGGQGFRPPLLRQGGYGGRPILQELCGCTHTARDRGSYFLRREPY